MVFVHQEYIILRVEIVLKVDNLKITNSKPTLRYNSYFLNIPITSNYLCVEGRVNKDCPEKHGLYNCLI